MATVPVVSEYEAKRLRRIAENHDKLQALDVPSLAVARPLATTRKTQTRPVEALPLEPPRKSLRQRKERYVGHEQHTPPAHRDPLDCTRVGLAKQLHCGKRLVGRPSDVAEHSQSVNEPKQGVGDAGTPRDECMLKHEQVLLESVDWRTRRKRQAQAAKRQAAVKLQAKRRAQRAQAKRELQAMQLHERRMRQEHKERLQLARLVEKELALQQRIEEGELMRMEDRAARQVARQAARDRKLQQLAVQKAEWKDTVGDVVAERQRTARARREARDKEMYPVRKLPLPFVHMTDQTDGGSGRAKPVRGTPLLKVEAHLFHAFALGKQFLPPGKNAVMQGMCPGGYTARFRHDVDVHGWANALTLFVHGTTGLFYRYMFEEHVLHGRTFVSFRWTRCQDVTPSMLCRLSRIQKGDERLRLDGESYDATATAEQPEPLLLFVQYPKGPYIYCGRLGVLGHRAEPLEISFQLLDVNALNWRQLFTLLTSG
ncbi:unnamed protein product [Hyaloperonospora brassicae]|uniref:Uncharacterized protein n=1 Tax=Hyaloperonospora brassicae TaxID=162125 RepID=A0AAV0TT74_HYABA|nr:unnamed protein product [Hyaloperonospora brassicae]